MAVIAQRERLRQRVRQRLEATKGLNPFAIVQRRQPDLRSGAIVAEAEPGLEIGGLHRVAIVSPSSSKAVAGRYACGVVGMCGYGGRCPGRNPRISAWLRTKTVTGCRPTG